MMTEKLRDWPADSVQRWPIDRIKPYPRNPKAHSDEGVRKIADSMKRFGVTAPVLVDEGGTLIYGHGRHAAAKLLGLAELPVAVARGWTEAEKAAYRVADNQLTLIDGFDMPMLKAELLELDLSGFDLSLLGFPQLELQQLMANPGNADPDEVQPEPPKQPVTRRGDLWILGDHRLLCGDATSPDDVQRLLGGARPHLMVVDPPYGVKYDAHWRDRELETWARPISVAPVVNDDRSDWTDAFKLFYGDVVYTWHPAGAKSVEFYNSLVSSGFEIRMQIIWAKPHYPIGRGNYHVQHEPCWYAVRKGKKAHWNGDRTQSTLWQIANASAFKGERGIGDEQTGHSTQKPIECMRRPIENNSKPGDGVYDPFVGSGTTIIAAELTGRKAFAIEIDPGYTDVAVRRWEKISGKRAYLDGNPAWAIDDIAKDRGIDLQKESAPVSEALTIPSEELQQIG